MTQQRIILITGATDGLGLSLARHYHAQGQELVLVGRRAADDASLSEFPPGSYCRADLSEPDCTERIVAHLAARQIERLDLLIHNAGLGYVGALSEQPKENIDALVAVNLWAPIALTHALLPHVRRAGGQIVFISSVVSALPCPNYAVYGASKAALDGFVRNLRIELGDAVKVQLIHPGAARTGMHAKSGVRKTEMDWDKFPAAELVAGQIAHAIGRRTKQTTIGGRNRVLRLVGRNLAGPVDAIIRGRSAPSDPPSAGQRPRCLITGAADGIGRALALRFGAAGYAITGVDIDAARSAETQAELAAAGVEGMFIQADLGNDADLESLLSRLAVGPPFAVIIHNAGINAVGLFETLPLAQQEAVLRVNFLAPLRLTAGLLKAEKLAAGGTLVFISSLSRYVSYPGAAVYAAGKDGLASFARSLNVALARDGFQTLTVYPGPTRTAHARRYSPDNRREARRMSPDVLAGQIFQAVQNRRRMLIPGTSNKVFALLGHLAPKLTEMAMRKTVLEKLSRF